MKILLNLIIIFSGLLVTALTQLEEGSECELESGGPGVCKKLPECPSELEGARKGRRTALSTRCGFSGMIEVVCCPAFVQGKINIPAIRPADVACHDYENEIISSERLSWHILGGTEAAAEEFPYMAALGYQIEEEDPDTALKIKKISYDCGGTIIAPRFILTAAHCVTNNQEKVPVVVRVGSVDLESKDLAQEIPIKEVIPHSKYRRSMFYYDIALLKLFEHLTWSKTVKPICLQTKATSEVDFDAVGTYLVVIGWGTVDIASETGSSKLLKTPSLMMIPRENCSSIFGISRTLPYGIDERTICAKDPNTTRRADACHGDSGGPLLLLSSSGDSIIGVTSFGQSCGGPNPAGYTSVYSFIEWIEGIVWPERSI